MSIQLEASLARIFTTDGAVVGTGFLVEGATILTCAHVIAVALGIPDDASIPEMPVSLDFPLVTSGYRVTAHVIFWQPVQDDGGGDIAVLRLKSSPPEETK